MGWSTTVIVPPDGDMDEYLKSLKKLLMRDDEIYLPTHGKQIDDPQNLVNHYISPVSYTHLTLPTNREV